jgi:peptidoglycan/LPS O-acetylase OafA/YrhL
MQYIWSKLYERFHRLTSGGKFVPEIDGLRFVAIASVVAFHLYVQLVRYYSLRLPWLPTTLLRNGEHGVRLFFVISGFILALPFASHRLRGTPIPSLKNYFSRRLTRLEPPYIINLFLCGLLLVIVNHISPRMVVPHLLASLVYCHNLFYGDMSTINPVAWSLEVEVQFYLIMPLLALAFAIRNCWTRRFVLLAAMLIAAFSQVHWADGPRAHLSIVYYIQFFLAGLLLADLHLTYGNGDKKYWWWDGLSIVGWPIVFLLDGPLLQLTLPFILIALYWAAFHGPLMNRLFRLPLITAIGGMCYTIYLFHFLVIALATRILGHSRPGLLLVILSLGLIAVVSSIYFLLIERPCMDRNWPQKLRALIWPPRKQPTAAIYQPTEVCDDAPTSGS